MENTKEKEIWRHIPGYENYQASSLGRIKSLDRTVMCKDGRKRFFKGKILGSNVNKANGYKQVGLSINGQSRVFNTSQIIATTFLNHTPDGHKLVIDHKNGDRSDDRACNLRIVTHRQNLSTCYRSNKETFTSKHVGVSWSKHVKKWHVQIVFEGKLIYLGLYDNELEASKAYQDALARIEDGTFNVNDYKPNFTSKFTGVSWYKRTKKWQAQACVNKKYKHIGYFKTEIEAHIAVQKFKQKQPLSI